MEYIERIQGNTVVAAMLTNKELSRCERALYFVKSIHSIHD